MRIELAKRFESKYISEPNSGCWLWEGGMFDNGYGAIWHSQEHKPHTIGAHRASWLIYRGSIPGDLEIDHRCRNRACVNPDHLEPVTCKVNLLRGAGVPAKNAAKTACIHGHEFTEENTRWTRQHKSDHRMMRICKTCVRNRKKARRLRISREPI